MRIILSQLVGERLKEKFWDRFNRGKKKKKKKLRVKISRILFASIKDIRLVKWSKGFARDRSSIFPFFPFNWCTCKVRQRVRTNVRDWRYETGAHRGRAINQDKVMINKLVGPAAPHRCYCLSYIYLQITSRPEHLGVTATRKSRPRFCSGHTYGVEGNSRGNSKLMHHFLSRRNLQLQCTSVPFIYSMSSSLDLTFD